MAGKPVKTFMPEPAARARYQELLAIYKDLWPTLERLECAPRRLFAERPQWLMRDWNALIEDVVKGHWTDPATGKPAKVPFETIMLAETLDGGDADVVAPLRLGRRLAVVSDVNTHEASGRRVAKSLKALGTIDEVVLPGDIACDEPTIALVRDTHPSRRCGDRGRLGNACRDTCKYATFLDGRPFATFGTAASMNGYAASTASVTLANGYKTSLAGACAARHLPRPQGLGRGAGLALRRRPRRQPVPPDRADRLVGLASPVRHVSIPPRPMHCRPTRKRRRSPPPRASASTISMPTAHCSGCSPLAGLGVCFTNISQSWLDGRAPGLALDRHVRRPRPSRHHPWPAGGRRFACHGQASERNSRQSESRRASSRP